MRVVEWISFTWEWPLECSPSHPKPHLNPGILGDGIWQPEVSHLQGIPDPIPAVEPAGPSASPTVCKIPGAKRCGRAWKQSSESGDAVYSRIFHWSRTLFRILSTIRQDRAGLSPQISKAAGEGSWAEAHRAGWAALMISKFCMEVVVEQCLWNYSGTKTSYSKNNKKQTENYAALLEEGWPSKLMTHHPGCLVTTKELLWEMESLP